MIPETPTPSAFPPPVPPKKHEDHITRGVLFGCAAMFLLAVMNTLAKIVSEHHNVIEIAFYRNLVALIPLTMYVLATRRFHLLKTRRPSLLFFRVIVGTAGLILTFETFALLPLADATVLILTSVLMVPALAYVLLGERMGPHRWSAIVIGLIGVIVMMRPTGHVETIGVLVGFTAASFQAGIQIFLRKLKTENSFTVVYYFILGGAVIGGLCMPFIAVTPAPDEFLMLICIGISGGLAQYCLTSAFRLGPASVISPLNYTGLIWATLFDIMIWQDLPSWPIFAGTAIIIASQGYILHRERVHAKRKS